jgi:hypothetical protein
VWAAPPPGRHGFVVCSVLSAVEFPSLSAVDSLFCLDSCCASSSPFHV